MQMNENEENTKLLASFALEFLKDFPDLMSVDGFEIQDLAVKHKLLIPRTVYSPCGDDCNCSEYHDRDEWPEGVTCYHVAEWLIRAAELLRVPAQPEQTCPYCKGEGYTRENGRVVWCDTCYGTGKSERSGGG